MVILEIGPLLVLTTALPRGDQATCCPRPVGRQIFKQQYSQLEMLQQQVRWAAQSTRTEPSTGGGTTQEESSPWKTGVLFSGPLAGVNLSPHFPQLNIIKYSLLMGQDIELRMQLLQLRNFQLWLLYYLTSKSDRGSCHQSQEHMLFLSL